MTLGIVQSTKHTYGENNIYGERTPVKISWSLIRHNYNPGDEGSGYGAEIAASIEHRKVDEKLNEEWRHLLKIAEGKKRSELIRRQRLWLKAIDKACREDGGAAPQWESAYFTMCLTDAFNKRISQFQDLRECITAKCVSCPALATDDPSANNEKYR
jgi:uncharacterized protein YecT (DUF1311 family)